MITRLNHGIALASVTGKYDRLSSMLFVTALAHGVVILGVTFAPLLPRETPPTPTMNVTLLVDTETLDANSKDAEMLSSRNQAGGGSDDSPRPTRTLAGAQPANQQGETLGVDTRTAEALAADTPADQIVSRGPSERRVEAVPETTDRPAPQPMTAAALLRQEAPDTLAAEIDFEVAGGSGEKSNIDSPSTRESAVAAYIVGWRQRIERVGTANFPRDLFAGESETLRLILEVTIDADGRLDDAVITRSSGNDRLDQVALDILELAGNFDPLPEAILADYDVLRFPYEWNFAPRGRATSQVR